MRQARLIAVWLMPMACAMIRVDQGVAAGDGMRREISGIEQFYDEAGTWGDLGIVVFDSRLMSSMDY